MSKATNKRKKPPLKKNPRRAATSPHDKDHDALTKVALSDIQGVSGLLQTELPDDILEDLDLSTLKRIADSYVDESLKSTFADKALLAKTKQMKPY